MDALLILLMHLTLCQGPSNISIYLYTTIIITFFHKISQDEALIAETAVWPNFFLMNVFFALKGSKLFIIINMRSYHATRVIIQYFHIFIQFFFITSDIVYFEFVSKPGHVKTTFFVSLQQFFVYFSFIRFVYIAYFVDCIVSFLDLDLISGHLKLYSNYYLLYFCVSSFN